jgi:hypothetical protein
MEGILKFLPRMRPVARSISLGTTGDKITVKDWGRVCMKVLSHRGVIWRGLRRWKRFQSSPVARYSIAWTNFAAPGRRRTLPNAATQWLQTACGLHMSGVGLVSKSALHNPSVSHALCTTPLCSLLLFRSRLCHYSVGGAWWHLGSCESF